MTHKPTDDRHRCIDVKFHCIVEHEDGNAYCVFADDAPEPQLIMGGQGRSADEVRDTASHLSRLAFWAVAILFCLGCWALVAALFGFFA
jgi:hypothetical protein